MGRIAVDVVLLLSEDMEEEAIAANRVLVERFGSEIVLNRENCLPHISLAMGSIDEGDIEAVGKVLEGLAKEQNQVELKILGVAVDENVAGQMVSCFELERTEAVQKLHESIMEEVGGYMSGEVTKRMLADRLVSESTLQWIRQYRLKSSFENFRPHITIGYGRIGGRSGIKIFKASRLALCHLGNHCTCRKVLVSFEF